MGGSPMGAVIMAQEGEAEEPRRSPSQISQLSKGCLAQKVPHTTSKGANEWGPRTCQDLCLPVTLLFSMGKIQAWDKPGETGFELMTAGATLCINSGWGLAGRT